MDASELWSDLKLGALLGNEPEEHLPLALQAALQSGKKKSKEKILLDHSKTWRKPSYNVLKDRYGSRPHDPPVLDASKLSKLADPIRGKFTSSYEKLLGIGRGVNPGDGTREEDDDGSETEQTRNYRYRNAASENTPETTANSQRRGKKMSSTSPSKAKLFGSGTRSSAFFLTAAGSDDEAEDSTVGFPEGPRQAGAGAVKSKFRAKLEEVKRNGKGIQEKLSRPLLEQKRKQPQKQQREPGLSRTKSGKFATAGAVGVNSTGKKKVNNNLSFTHIKSSIPPQQPHPRRKPLTKIFDAGSVWNSRGVVPKLPGKTMRRGAAPVDQPLGVGLDLSNVSSNGAGGGLAERRAQRLARAKVGLSGAARVAQSKDTTDIPAVALEVDRGTASGGGVNAAARIRAARAGPGRGPGGIKSAPGQLSTQVAAARPVPASVPVDGIMQPRGGRVPPLAQRDVVAAAALDLTSAAAAPGNAPARRKKSVTIDPSLSPFAKDKRNLSSGPGFSAAAWKGLSRSSSSREASASPRTKLVRSKSTHTGWAAPFPVTSTAPVTAETDGVSAYSSSLKGSVPVDMASMQSNLEKIQAREKDRMGAKEAEVSAAALLMQHAKRLSSQFDKALEFSSKYNDIDYAPVVALGKSSNKIVI